MKKNKNKNKRDLIWKNYKFIEILREKIFPFLLLRKIIDSQNKQSDTKRNNNSNLVYFILK